MGSEQARRLTLGREGLEGVSDDMLWGPTDSEERDIEDQAKGEECRTLPHSDNK